MNRATFVWPLLAVLTAARAGASSERRNVPLDFVLDGMRARAARTTTMVVRHVGAFVSTVVEIGPERLARLKPIAIVNDRTTIAAVLRAVVAANPMAIARTSEQRWHLTFLDADGMKRAVVTSSIAAPRLGTIDGREVVFGNDALVRLLASRFAPQEREAM